MIFLQIVISLRRSLNEEQNDDDILDETKDFIADYVDKDTIDDDDDIAKSKKWFS